MEPYDFHTFSTKLLKDILTQYDYFNIKLISIGCIILVSN